MGELAGGQVDAKDEVAGVGQRRAGGEREHVRLAGRDAGTDRHLEAASGGGSVLPGVGAPLLRGDLIVGQRRTNAVHAEGRRVGRVSLQGEIASTGVGPGERDAPGPATIGWSQ